MTKKNICKLLLLIPAMGTFIITGTVQGYASDALSEGKQGL